MKPALQFLIPVAAIIGSSWVAAEPEEKPVSIRINGLLGDKAILVVEGTQHLIAAGEITPEGVELVAVEEDGARLKVDGEVRFLPLGGRQVGTRYTQHKQIQERVYRKGRGDMFQTTGTINGMPVDFIVDTGATTVAMGINHAKRLGIDYQNGRPVNVQTASGSAKAWHVTLNTVAVGQIKLSNIDAVVIEQSTSPHILLGMSFLDRLDIERKGEVMVLEMQY